MSIVPRGPGSLHARGEEALARHREEVRRAKAELDRRVALARHERLVAELARFFGVAEWEARRAQLGAFGDEATIEGLVFLLNRAESPTLEHVAATHMIIRARCPRCRHSSEVGSEGLYKIGELVEWVETHDCTAPIEA